MLWMGISFITWAVWSSYGLVTAQDASETETISQNAIYVSNSNASTTTSFTLENTRITITKTTGARAHFTGSSGQRPRIVVTDAAAKGLVCLPTSTLQGVQLGSTGQHSSGSAAAAVAGGAAAAAAAGGGAAAAAAAGGNAEIAKAEVVGQGVGITASAGAGGASASASGGGSAAAAGGGSVDASGQNAEAISLEEHNQLNQYNPRACECVPEYLCDEEGFVITYGEGLIDIRFKGKNKTVVRSPVQCRAEETCCRHHDDQRVAISWFPEQCGEHSPARLDARIIGGQAAGIGKYPWMTAVLRQTDEHLLYICGGSLIRPDIVLTGAHCVKAWVNDRLMVRVGEWDTNMPDEVYPHQDVSVASVVYHNQFNEQTLFNDVALLKLERPVELAQHINPICLPSPGQYANIDFGSCVATGWGKQAFGNSNYSSILKEIQLSVVDSDQCQASLRTTRLGEYFKLHPSFICAGGLPGEDTCTGDGGSPLVCRDTSVQGKTVHVQVGIVAWGIGCGDGGVPGVYADVTKQYEWIAEQMGALAAAENQYY